MLKIDPFLFTEDAITAETRAFNAQFEAQLADMPATHEVPAGVTRAARDAGQGIFPSLGPLEGSHWMEIPNAPGTGRIRISPAPTPTPSGIYMHIHGGGWTLGRPSHDDARNQAIARAANVVVASVEYRLAPEHVWPAQREDCLAAVQWLMGAGAETLGSDRIVIGGESAGGHLSLATALTLRDMQRSEPVAGLVLNYGVFDLRMTPSMASWGARKLVLSTPTVEWFIDNLDPTGRQRRGAGLSPLLAHMDRMPPALFQIGTADPLLDDTLMMASRYVTAGNDAELAVYPGGVHAFDAFQDLEISRALWARQGAFVKKLLS